LEKVMEMQQGKGKWAVEAKKLAGKWAGKWAVEAGKSIRRFCS
jgi:hypothetical protein